MTDREKFETICDLTTNTVGLQQGSLAYKTRKQELVYSRMIASVIGIKNTGIHPDTIADVIKKDRTSILYYYKMHKHNYSSTKKYRDFFNKVYAAFNNSENIKLVFKNRDELCEFLINAGVKISTNADIKLKIKSGKAVYKLPTTYLQMDYNTEIINKALKDYDYKCDIITL
tara:strand:+ start:351 stop:866 length:516 start_codon:yes stop_codon:yes gene_type:complete